MLPSGAAVPDFPSSLTVPLVRQSLSPRIFPASPPSHTALLSPRTIPAASSLQPPLSARMILTPPPSLLALLSLGTIPASTHTPAKLLKPRNDSSLPRPSPQAPISPGTIPTSHPLSRPPQLGTTPTSATSQPTNLPWRLCLTLSCSTPSCPAAAAATLLPSSPAAMVLVPSP